MSKSLKSKLIEYKSEELNKSVKSITQTVLGSTLSLSSAPLSVSNLKTIKKQLYDVLVNQEKIGTISDFKIADARSEEDDNKVRVDLMYQPMLKAASIGISTSVTMGVDFAHAAKEELTEEEKYERFISNKDW